MKAVVFIDVQKDFITGGSLAYGYPAKDIVPNIIDFSRECRSKGYALYATADTHEPSYDSTGKPNDGGYKFTLEGNRLPVEHCIVHTKGHRFADGLAVDSAGDVVIPRGNIIYKKTFGSRALGDKILSDFCCDTYGKTIDHGAHECDEVWTGNGEPLDEILICGFCTSICVVSNALMLRAQLPNVKITVLEDLCGDVDQVSHEAALKVLANCQIDVKHWKD